LLVFTPQLAQAKRTGLSESAAGERYVREFDAKWLRAVRQPARRSWAAKLSPLRISPTVSTWSGRCGRPDYQGCHCAPRVAVHVPIVPLALTMMSPEYLRKKLFELLF
jgi:hypothetical protein